MKKLMTIMLGLSLLTGAVATVMGQEPAKTEKKEKKSKKSTEKKEKKSKKATAEKK